MKNHLLPLLLLSVLCGCITAPRRTTYPPVPQPASNDLLIRKPPTAPAMNGRYRPPVPVTPLAGKAVAPKSLQSATTTNLYISSWLVYDDPDFGQEIGLHVGNVQFGHTYRLQKRLQSTNWTSLNALTVLNVFGDYVFWDKMYAPPPYPQAAGQVSEYHATYRIKDETPP